MLQIFLDHLFGHLPHSGAKVAACPKGTPPVTLFQPGKFFEQLAGRAPLDAAHHLTGCQLRRRRDQNVNGVLTDNPFEDPNLERLTGLSYPLANLLPNIPPLKSSCWSDQK